MAHRRICRIPEEKYQALVAFFRKHPGATWKAAEACGVRTPTSHRVWHRGYDDPVWARKAVKQLLEEEQQLARAAIEKAEQEKVKEEERRRQETADLARVDAVKERAREAQVVRGSMSAALTVLASALELQNAQLELAKFVSGSILLEAEQGKIEWAEAFDILKQCAGYSSAGLGIARAAMEIQRIHLGTNLTDAHAAPPSKVEVAEAKAAMTVSATTASTILGFDHNEALKQFDDDEERVRKAVSDLVLGNLSEDAAKVVDLAAARAARSAG